MWLRKKQFFLRTAFQADFCHLSRQQWVDFQKQLCLSSNMQIEIYLDKQTVNNSFLVAFFTRTCHVILMKTIAYDKQTVNNSFLVAFFTHTCHVILMKTIAYVTVTFNKNIIERHALFGSLFSTTIIKGGDIRWYNCRQETMGLDDDQ